MWPHNKYTAIYGQKCFCESTGIHRECGEGLAQTTKEQGPLRGQKCVSGANLTALFPDLDLEMAPNTCGCGYKPTWLWKIFVPKPEKPEGAMAMYVLGDVTADLILVCGSRATPEG